jgi:hypothetical protein
VPPQIVSVPHPASPRARLEDLTTFGEGAAAIDARSGGAGGVLAINPVPDPNLSVERARRAVTAQVQAMEPGEATPTETRTVAAGEAVSAAATFRSGHVLHVANVVGADRVFQVHFLTTLPLSQSGPVFDAIVDSIRPNA